MVPLLPQIAQELREALPRALARWKTLSSRWLAGHDETIEMQQR
jgi:hypothetical protein